MVHLLPATTHVSIADPYKTNDHYVMKLLPIIIFSIAVLLMQRANGQELPLQFDTIPPLNTPKNGMTFQDEVRCVAYLFNKDFRVYDSLRDIHVDFYVNSDWLWMDEKNFEELSYKVYHLVYKIGMAARIEYFKNNFKDFVVSFYDQEGRLLHIKYFGFPQDISLPASLQNIDAVCSSLRVPTTWSLVDKGIQFVFWCLDQQERSVFPEVLYWNLNKLGFIEKKLAVWRVYLLSCAGKIQDQFIISGNHE